MNDIVDEIRAAYTPFGIELGERSTYGTYYGLRCSRCKTPLGAVGDKLLPGMIRTLLDDQFDLYAAGLLGCTCGHQAERARTLDSTQAEAAKKRFR